MPRSRLTVLTTLALVVAGVTVASPATAAKPCKACRDTTPPTVHISAPASGASVTGTTAVSGTSSDNAAVSSVAIAVDGGTWQPASGTGSWTWTWSTSALTNGTHTVAARALDTAGNATVTSESVTVANPVPDTAAPTVSITSPSAGSSVSGTVSISGTAADNVSVAAIAVAVDGGSWQAATGTTSWTWSWNTTTQADGAHSVAVRATDTSGNASTASVSVTTSNTSASPPPTTPPPTNAPATQGSWVSPEGVRIDVNTAGTWTIAQIYSLLQANALDLTKVGAHLTIEVQDQYTSQTQTSATYYAGKYTAIASTIWLQGVNSGFATRPDDTLTHEYGHAWSMYWYYLVHQGSWAPYENARWTTADGSLTLATDSRTGTSYTWNVEEIVADDYRLLFGSSAAISERATHLNNQIPDPRNVAGLATFLSTTWRTA